MAQTGQQSGDVNLNAPLIATRNLSNAVAMQCHNVSQAGGGGHRGQKSDHRE
jgi:hypothetical protein